MKKISILVTVTLIVFSCSEDRLSEEVASSNQATLAAERSGFTEATLDGPELRISFDQTERKLDWENDDYIKVWRFDGDLFKNSLSYSYNGSMFTGSSLTRTQIYYGFYPQIVNKSTDETLITLDLPNDQIWTGTRWDENISKYDFMYSDQLIASTSNTQNSLKFKHGVAFFDVQLTSNIDSLKLYEIELVSNESIFPTQVLASVPEGDILSIGYGLPATSVSLHIHKNNEIGIDIGKETVFSGLIIVGEIEKEKHFSVKFRTNKGVYHKGLTTNATLGIEKGKYYKLTRTIGTQNNNLQRNDHDCPAHVKAKNNIPFMIADKKTIYIYTAEDLQWLSTYSNNGTKQDKTFPPLNFSGWTIVLANENINMPNTWIPIKVFNGTFEGHEHTIKGLANALFATLNGTVKSLNLDNVNITENNTNNIGAVANINNGTILDVTVTSGVIGNSENLFNNVGGIVGSNRGYITDCTNGASVTGANAVGGIVGQNGNASLAGTITGAINTGSINGTINVGGIIGINTNGSVSDSENDAMAGGEPLVALVSGSGNNVGGIIGKNAMTDALLIFNCSNNAIIEGNNSVGGIIGNQATTSFDACQKIKDNNNRSIQYIYSIGGNVKGKFIGNLKCN